MKYNIYISDIDKKKVLQLPVNPETLPSFSYSSKNEEFETFNNGTYNIIGDVGLMSFSLESFFPSQDKEYPFQKVFGKAASEYVNLIKTAQLNKKPIRVVIQRNTGSYILNGTFSVESFEYHTNKRNDIEYSLELKEWRKY